MTMNTTLLLNQDIKQPIMAQGKPIFTLIMVCIPFIYSPIQSQLLFPSSIPVDCSNFHNVQSHFNVTPTCLHQQFHCHGLFLPLIFFPSLHTFLHDDFILISYTSSSPFQILYQRYSKLYSFIYTFY